MVQVFKNIVAHEGYVHQSSYDAHSMAILVQDACTGAFCRLLCLRPPSEPSNVRCLPSAFSCICELILGQLLRTDLGVLSSPTTDRKKTRKGLPSLRVVLPALLNPLLSLLLSSLKSGCRIRAPLSRAQWTSSNTLLPRVVLLDCIMAWNPPSGDTGGGELLYLKCQNS